ncbi:hypothetical protein GGI20_002564 [Coemansia sp. BCRC 34301]|nr:hypothetical protein GGI20_002564 [Coemansia sp. BCRC 34301]
MAKSVRSKSKIKKRNIMRKALFGPLEDERIQRLAAKQQVTAPPPPPQTKEEEDVDMENDAKATTSGRGVSKRTSKRRQQNKSGRVVVRNKKGRILSKTGVKWVKQIRPKR